MTGASSSHARSGSFLRMLPRRVPAQQTKTLRCSVHPGRVDSDRRPLVSRGPTGSVQVRQRPQPRRRPTCRHLLHNQAWRHGRRPRRPAPKLVGDVAAGVAAREVRGHGAPEVVLHVRDDDPRRRSSAAVARPRLLASAGDHSGLPTNRFIPQKISYTCI